MLRCMSLLLALFSDMANVRLESLSGDEQKSNFGAVRSVDDPERTLRSVVH